ncbi:hypothetical protein, partial [Aeromonas veronii]|uniref:hypothetical protein n=1 Tax=Aeromonas veronii TaxID=654 RepID=UPI003007121B
PRNPSRSRKRLLKTALRDNYLEKRRSHQLTFADYEFNGKRRKTREVILDSHRGSAPMLGVSYEGMSTPEREAKIQARKEEEEIRKEFRRVAVVAVYGSV